MNRNIIRDAREKADMSMNDVERKLERLSQTRDDLIPISSARLGRIERGDAPALPEEIYSLSCAYDDPMLCYEYCSSRCTLGRKTLPSMQWGGGLRDITCALLGAVREFEETEKRLTILVQDGKIDSYEEKEFNKILEILEKLSSEIQAMKFWAQNYI